MSIINYQLSMIMATLIIAHRGGALLGTENSLSCIERGIQTGAQMVEVDLHLTADKHIVVCHDQSVDRTTDGKGRIEEMTLEQIQKLHLLTNDGIVSNETIPTLEQVLDICQDRCRLLLEIKKKRADQYEGIEQLADSIVKAHHMQDQVIFQSFNDDVLFKLHALDPSLRLEKLLVFRMGNILFDNGFTRFNYDKYDFVASFNIFRWFASKCFIRDVHAHGKEVKVWTVNKPADNALQRTVDGIITDRPDLFIHNIE